MNERIRELKQQAIDYVDSVDDGLGIEEYRELVDLKFAELIVAECQHRVEQYINECGEVASMPKSVIMKHFGVE
jgi:hypothetical protein